MARNEKIVVKLDGDAGLLQTHQNIGKLFHGNGIDRENLLDVLELEAPPLAP
jgi:hypothetical protein